MNTKLRVQIPCVALRPFVKHFLVVESIARHSDMHLPDTGLVAAFGFRGNCQLESGDQAPRTALTGLWDTVRRHDHSQDHAVVIAAFTSTGAAALLREPLDQFANTTTDLAAVLGNGAGLDGFHDQLAGAANHAARIQLVEYLLLALTDNPQVDTDIAAAVSLIEETQAMTRIDAIAQQIGLSQSALERRFRRFVGTSPRRFASLVRLRNVVRLYEAGADFTTIAHAAGYCDQSHFIKDFNRLTGVAPGSFFARSFAN